MKIKQHLGFISMLAIAFTACQQKPAETDNFLENEIKNIEAQHTLQTDLIEKSGKILNPRTIDEKGNIVPAEAEIINGSARVKVWNDSVPHPVEVRYCFRNYMEGDLFNNAEIPASPFRIVIH